MTAFSPEDDVPSPELSPRRMLDGGGGEHERRLIASAQLDRVPSGAKARVAAALGGVLEPPVSPSAAPEPEVATREQGVSRLGARAGLSMVGAGVVASVALALWLRMTPAPNTEVLSPPPASPAPTPAAAEADPTASSRAEAGDETARAPLVEPTLQAEHLRQKGEREAPSVARRPQRGGAKDHVEPVDSGLLAEVRALEAVSAALAAGQEDRAARELAAYRRRFARGELEVEAGVLSIQIAMLRGDRALASATAEQLLARPDTQHYRARVRELLEGATPSAESVDPEKAARARSNEAAAHMRVRR